MQRTIEPGVARARIAPSPGAAEGNGRTNERPPAGPRARRRGPRGRRVEPAGKALIAILVGFLVWLLLAAPALKRSAEASPFGARRTASIIVLAPFDALSRVLQLSRVDRAAQSALGRDTGGNASITSGSNGPVGAAPPGVDATHPTLPPQASPKPSITPQPGDVTPPPAVLPATVRKPTLAHPLTVLAIGDSIGIDLGYGLQRVMGNTGYYKVIVDGRISTGLARPDYYNWPAQLSYDIQRYRPDIVVALFGLNDPQAMRVGSTYLPTFSRTWFDEYSRRVDKMLELGTGGGRHMVWAGGPIVSDSHLRHDMNELNGVYRKQVRYYPKAYFFDTWRHTSSNGVYTAFLTGSDGNRFLARTGDGDHFTNEGEDALARVFFQEFRARFLGKGPRNP
jgi:uncharacterized protein